MSWRAELARAAAADDDVEKVILTFHLFREERSMSMCMYVASKFQRSVRLSDKKLTSFWF